MMQDETKILDFRNRTRNKPGTPARPSIPLRYNNGNGGGSNMDDKDFVTHTELKLSSEKLLHHMDNQFNRLGNKIDGQKVWMLKELSATAIFIVTILGFLITIFEFLK
ncbi:hypothetical protein [Limosilactobacillus fermentum]|nr:hypothetical protein [Limosilactobacillus fermentum]MCH5396203.1 hypothetical protein [Limosilactobacillus fermentum]NHD43637.1 hypothetical protein [Limosilactobacillus fermentum]